MRLKEILKRTPLITRAVRLIRAIESAFKSHGGLAKRVAELEARMSVVDGRSSLNAERIVRTHASLQNLAEDFETVTERLIRRVDRSEQPQVEEE